jgi:hypothetical protein
MVAERLPVSYHLFAIHRIHHRDMVGKYRPLAGDFADAEAVQRRERIRPELDTRAISPISCAFSSSITLMPWRASESAVAAPPIPPPTIIARVTFAMFPPPKPEFCLVDFPARRR